jgi:hypothetical protein
MQSGKLEIARPVGRESAASQTLHSKYATADLLEERIVRSAVTTLMRSLRFVIAVRPLAMETVQGWRSAASRTLHLKYATADPLEERIVRSAVTTLMGSLKVVIAARPFAIEPVQRSGLAIANPQTAMGHPTLLSVSWSAARVAAPLKSTVSAWWLGIVWVLDCLLGTEQMLGSAFERQRPTDWAQAKEPACRATAHRGIGRLHSDHRHRPMVRPVILNPGCHFERAINRRERTAALSLTQFVPEHWLLNQRSRSVTLQPSHLRPHH